MGITWGQLVLSREDSQVRACALIVDNLFEICSGVSSENTSSACREVLRQAGVDGLNTVSSGHETARTKIVGAGGSDGSRAISWESR